MKRQFTQIGKRTVNPTFEQVKIVVTGVTACSVSVPRGSGSREEVCGLDTGGMWVISYCVSSMTCSYREGSTWREQEI